LHRKNDVDLCFRSQLVREPLRGPICMLRIAQPNVVIQQSDPGRSQETHFRRKLAGLFNAIIEFAS